MLLALPTRGLSAEPIDERRPMTPAIAPTARPLVEQLKASQANGRSPTIVAELRPPSSALRGAQSMDAWIDLEYSLRTLNRRGFYTLFTDNAVGAAEEENLRHFSANADPAISRHGLVPILTCLHSLDYCLRYAARAHAQGFSSLAVLGGDKKAGIQRCVQHAWELRERIRGQAPGLALGGWANPHADPAVQVGFLTNPRAHADFYLTQVVSSSQIAAVECFLERGQREGLRIPGLFGVFHYRSANPKTLAVLSQFLPVPQDEIRQAFADGLTSVDITARSVAALRRLGIQNIYVSNLPSEAPLRTLEAILARAEGF